MPGGDIPYLLPGCLAAAALLLVWIACLISHAILQFHHKKSVTELRRNWLNLCVFPSATVLSLLIVQSGVPFYVAFRISKPALERLVTEVRENNPEPPNQWVGVFPVRQIRRIPGGVEFAFKKDEFPWGTRGLYHSYDGSELHESRYSGQLHVNNEWYTWHYGGW